MMKLWYLWVNFVSRVISCFTHTNIISVNWKMLEPNTWYFTGAWVMRGVNYNTIDRAFLQKQGEKFDFKLFKRFIGKEFYAG